MNIFNIIPPTSKRVSLHTNKQINKRIQEKIQHNIEHFKGLGKEAILARLDQLDREWDIERILEMHAATVILLLFIGSLFIPHIIWSILIAIVASFLMLHAIQGWCPPLPFFRRLGFRTSAEIDEEKYALKRYI